jgi:hypothetical protein
VYKKPNGVILLLHLCAFVQHSSCVLCVLCDVSLMVSQAASGCDWLLLLSELLQLVAWPMCVMLHWWQHNKQPDHHLSSATACAVRGCAGALAAAASS